MRCFRGREIVLWVKRRSVAIPLLIGLCLVLAGPASASIEGKGVLISHTGTWTFARLGLPKIVVRPGNSVWRDVVVDRAFRLPKGVRQGPIEWFRLRLHYEVDIAPDTGPGQIYFSVNTNGPGGTSAQIIFNVRRLASGGMAVSSDSLGLVGGHVIREGHQQVWRGEFENYIPYPGIRAGNNSLGVRIEHLYDDEAHAARAVVFPDSAIVYAPISPARLGLQLHLPARARVGQRVPIQVTVENVGGHRTVAGTVGIAVPPQLVPIGSRSASLPSLRSRESRTFVFSVEPRRAGRFHVTAGARAGLGKPQRYATLRVTPAPAGPSRNGASFPWWWIPPGAAGLLLLAAVSIRQVRGRPQGAM